MGFAVKKFLSFVFIATSIGLASRAEAQVTLEADVLPIITSPMSYGGSVETEVAKVAAAPIPDASTVSEAAVPASPQRPESHESALQAAAPAVSKSAAVSASTGPRFVCRGTAPFWSLNIESTHMDFELSGYGKTKYSAPAATASLNSENAVTKFAGTDQNGSDLIALVVNARLNGGTSCSDNMSEHSYEFSVFLNRSGAVYDGCCWIERDN